MTDEHPSTCVDPETMAAFIDGRLDTSTSARVETHLAACDQCYEQFADAVAMARREDTRAQGGSAAHGDWRRGWLAAAALLLALGGLWWWRSPQRRIAVAVTELADAQRTMRFSTGQLSVDQQWAPAPAPTRGASGDAEASLEVRAAVISIERASEGHVSAPALHALGLAHLASGDVATAVTNLMDALSLAGDEAPAPLRDDLAAALLEQYRTDRNAADLTRALDNADRALRQTPNDPAALFNRALALDTLGPKDLAVHAWQAYLQHEERPAWLAEARERLQALTAKPSDTSGATTSLLHLIEDQVLPAWLAATQQGIPADTHALHEASIALGQATPDHEFAQLLPALERAAADHGEMGCAQNAVAGLLAWRHAYEMLDGVGGQRAADQEGQGLACLGLRRIGADISRALLDDRNAAYDHLTTLADTAERLGFLRAAALARISLGNTTLRRTDLTTGIRILEHAGSLAVTAGDRELAATAEAMVGDAYQEEGNEALAWLHLQRALTWLPSVQSPRLFYSIIRACADEARLEGQPAASLAFSALLLRPGTNWTYPGALAYARIERADALQQIGATQDADAELRVASEEMTGMPAGSIRDELANELETARGHLESATAPAAALAPLADAIRYFRGHDTTFRLVGVLTDRGRAEQAMGQAGRAEQDWADGATLIEDQQPSIREEQLRISRLSSLWDVYGDLISARLSRPVAALQTAERARARELLDSLGRNQRLGRFDPLVGAALWSWLPDDTTAIVFCVLPNVLVRWTVQSSGVTEAQLPVSAARLDVLAHLAVARLQEGQSTAASSLGQLLFDDVHLGPTTTRLLIVPDGALHYVPFAALSFGDDPRFLIQRVTVITAPSLSAARALSTVHDPQPHPQMLLAGYGDPEEGLPRLPGVATELREVRQLYPSATVLAGASATPATVMAAAVHSAMVHIASHAVINAAFPSQSHLVLAPGADGNGALRPADIAAAAFQEHPLVFLSACATATGEIYRGEGVMSLARPFLAGGASAVIATMWPIGDADTAPITSSIYHSLRHRSPEQALAESQRTAIANGVRIDQWASFVVFGGLNTTVLHLDSRR